LPEIAARAIFERIDGLIEDALGGPRARSRRLDGVPPPGSPLIGGVMVGRDGRQVGWPSARKPFLAIPISRVSFTVRLERSSIFPSSAAGVGWHCQLLTVRVPQHRGWAPPSGHAVGECDKNRET